MEQNKNSKTEEQIEQQDEKEVDIVKELEEKLKEKENSYLRLFAEFDNFRKRSAKERIEQSKLAGRDIIQDFIPVLDDIDRAIANIHASSDIQGIKEGVNLIADKLHKTLQSKGLQEMNVVGEQFDPEMHEAITEIPAPTDEQKGTIIDQVEKGYKLNDVIIRYPKVVVGK